MEIKAKGELINSMSLGLFGWYDFKKGGKLLFAGPGEETAVKYLTERGLKAESISFDEINELWGETHAGLYDYVILIALPETVPDPTQSLNVVKWALKEDGTLLLGMNNRLGLRYFCGDRDPYTGRCFDGIEGYSDPAVSVNDGRCYSRSELKTILDAAGFDRYRFYSVLPDLSCAAFLFSEDYLPKEDMSNRVFPYYDDPDSVFLAEQSLYPSFIEEGLFHATANAFLMECTVKGELSKIRQVTASLDRGREDAAFTIIRGGDLVEKRAAFPEGIAKFERMCAHDKDLRAHGIRVIESRMEKGSYIMPFSDKEVTQTYFKKLLFSDKDKFISEMDAFRDTVLRSSERYVAKDGTEVFKKGYFDLVPLNSFRDGSDFIFFDQEFCVEDLPVKVMALRQVLSFYFGDPKAEKELPKAFFLERYGLLEERERLQKIEWDFLNSLLKKDELKGYYGLHRTDMTRIRKRRTEMDRRFINILEDADKKKVYLFGSGKYADKFLSVFGNDISIAGIIDNNPEKTGEKKQGIVINSPDILSSLEPGSFKIIICLKDYESVARQLRGMGIESFSVFDPNRSHVTGSRTSIKIVKDLPRGEGSDLDETAHEKSADYHCHIGYCAGAFDMFHIGHLNLLRRAKERCDYLIVGVMSDERMYNLKKKYPVIPCNERMQVVAGCRYVDQVEELPADRAGIMDAWNMFHYDCMFSGDDHAEDPGWLAERERLRQHGSDIVFVSYTKEQSSSAIRGKMNKS